MPLHAAIWSGKKGDIEGSNIDKVINIQTHELEHALYQRYSLKSNIGNIEARILPKRANKMLAKAPKLNENLTKMQQNLLMLFGCGYNVSKGTFSDVVANREGLIKVTRQASFEELQSKIRDIVRNTIVLPNNDEDNLMLLKAARQILQDEARA